MRSSSRRRLDTFTEIRYPGTLVVGRRTSAEQARASRSAFYRSTETLIVLMRLQTFNMHCQQQRGLKKVVMRFLQKETKSHATVTWKPSHPRMVRPSSSRKLLPSPKQVCTHTSPAESIFPNLRQRVPSRWWHLTETLLGVRIAKCRSLALRCRAGCKCRGVGTGRASCKPKISGSVWPHRVFDC